MLGWEQVVIDKFTELEKSLAAYKLNLIIVDDGSKESMKPKADNIHTQIQDFQLITHRKNLGKGAALRTGVTAADSDIILYTDIDFPYTKQSVIDIIATLEGGTHPIAIGKRNETYYDNIPKKRAWISRMLKTTIKTLLRLPAYDTQCGLKAFRHGVKEVFLKTKTDRYLVDLEFLRIANRDKKLKVKPVQVDLREGIELSEVSTKLLMDESWSFVKILFS